MNVLTTLPAVVSFTDNSTGDTKRLCLNFANGYSASVIQGPGSYGGSAGLFEIAVLHGGTLVYDTPITDDVLGYLHSEEVPEICLAIADLPPRT